MSHSCKVTLSLGAYNGFLFLSRESTGINDDAVWTQLICIYLEQCINWRMMFNAQAFPLNPFPISPALMEMGTSASSCFSQ